MLPFPNRGRAAGWIMADRRVRPPKLLTPREASEVLRVGYTTLKQWIYAKKLRTVKTPGGHHRIPESEIDRLLPRKAEKGSVETRRKYFRRISGRNQLLGRITDIRIDGLLAQVTISIAGQRINSIITSDAAREMRLQRGQIVAALIKSTEVMIIRPD
jgi:molybdopterin-binding protein